MSSSLVSGSHISPSSCIGPQPLSPTCNRIVHKLPHVSNHITTRAASGSLRENVSLPGCDARHVKIPNFDTSVFLRIKNWQKKTMWFTTKLVCYKPLKNIYSENLCFLDLSPCKFCRESHCFCVNFGSSKKPLVSKFSLFACPGTRKKLKIWKFKNSNIKMA